MMGEAPGTGDSVIRSMVKKSHWVWETYSTSGDLFSSLMSE